MGDSSLPLSIVALVHYYYTPYACSIYEVSKRKQVDFWVGLRVPRWTSTD